MGTKARRHQAGGIKIKVCPNCARLAVQQAAPVDPFQEVDSYCHACFMWFVFARIRAKASARGNG